MKYGGNCPGPPCARRAKGGRPWEEEVQDPAKTKKHKQTHTYIYTYKLHLRHMYIVCHQS